MALADVDMCATDAGLEVEPEVFHTVHMNIRATRQMVGAHILFGAVVHELMFPIIALVPGAGIRLRDGRMAGCHAPKDAVTTVWAVSGALAGI